jgi:hypothetical protein
MAPSEFDLREALRDGEGDDVDAGRVIMIGQAYRDQRAQRRTRLLSAAAVFAIVTGGAIGLSRLGGNDDGSGNGSGGAPVAGAGGAFQDQPHSSNRSASGSAYGAVNGVGTAASVPAVPNVAEKAMASVDCPASAPQYELAGGGGSTAYGGSGPLFRTTVSSAVVCAYGTSLQAIGATTRHPARLDLAGAQAAVLTRSMERSALVQTLDCTAGTTTHYQFAVIAFGDSGSRIRPTVSAELGCHGVTTNGTAVRYNWSPPPGLARRLIALTPAGVPASPNASPTG